MEVYIRFTQIEGQIGEISVLVFLGIGLKEVQRGKGCMRGGEKVEKRGGRGGDG